MSRKRVIDLAASLALILAVLACAGMYFHFWSVNRALLVAAQQGDPERAIRALAGGANPNARGPAGGTALMAACRSGSRDVVVLLLARGADPGLADTRGETPLIRVAYEKGEIGGRIAIVRALLAAGADADTRSISGSTPLMRAAIAGDLALVRLLLARGADPRAKGQRGRTPLWFARYTLYSLDADRRQPHVLVEGRRIGSAFDLISHRLRAQREIVRLLRQAGARE